MIEYAARIKVYSSDADGLSVVIKVIAIGGLRKEKGGDRKDKGQGREGEFSL